MYFNYLSHKKCGAEKSLLDRSKFQDQFSFSFLVPHGTIYVDKENFELLFITRNKNKMNAILNYT